MGMGEPQSWSVGCKQWFPSKKHSIEKGGGAQKSDLIAEKQEGIYFKAGCQGQHQ